MPGLSIGRKTVSESVNTGPNPVLATIPEWCRGSMALFESADERSTRSSGANLGSVS